MSFIKKAFQFTSLILFLAVLIFSAVKFSMNSTDSRYVMYFNSLDTDCLCTEIRFLNDTPHQGKEQFFVEELLLGPMTNRYIPLFNKNTTCDFCFVRDKCLYVGLSSEALVLNSETEDLKNGLKIFRTNIMKNFKNINTVMMYIDGREV